MEAEFVETEVEFVEAVAGTGAEADKGLGGAAEEERVEEGAGMFVENRSIFPTMLG